MKTIPDHVFALRWLHFTVELIRSWLAATVALCLYLDMNLFYLVQTKEAARVIALVFSVLALVLGLASAVAFTVMFTGLARIVIDEKKGMIV